MTQKVAITMDVQLLKRIDHMVKKHIFPNRSQAICIALGEKISRIDKNRLASECLKLNPQFEQAMAEEGFSQEINEWPVY